MPYVGQDTEFHVDDSGGTLTDLSDKCTNVAPAFNVALHDDTAFGDDWRTFVAGLRDGTVTVNMFADEDTDEHMFGIMGRQVSIRIDPYGATSGRTRLTFEAFLQTWSLADPIDGLVTKNASFQITGAVTRAAIT